MTRTLALDIGIALFGCAGVCFLCLAVLDATAYGKFLFSLMVR